MTVSTDQYAIHGLERFKEAMRGLPYRWSYVAYIYSLGDGRISFRFLYCKVPRWSFGPSMSRIYGTLRLMRPTDSQATVCGTHRVSFLEGSRVSGRIDRATKAGENNFAKSDHDQRVQNNRAKIKPVPETT